VPNAARRVTSVSIRRPFLGVLISPDVVQPSTVQNLNNCIAIN